jgi:hypothetical protein
MSVRPVDAQRSFYDTDYLCGDLFGPANRYRLFREKIWPKLLELAPKLEALYCAQNGRPPIDPVLPRCWFIFATGWKRKKPIG